VEGPTESGERARLRLLRGAVAGARTLDDLALHVDSLRALADRGSGAAADATDLEASIARLRLLPDSAAPGVPVGDMRLFLAAEEARDVLGAPLLAAALFRQVAEQWPASPYAPKALLAGARLEPSDAEAARARLDSLYPGSPYMAVLRGQAAPEYRVLEDSLEAFAAAQSPAPRRLRPGERRRVEDEPGVRTRRRDRQPGDKTTPDTRHGLEP
jgi:hypothetical protein